MDVLGCKAFQAAELRERLREAGLLPRLRALHFACHRWVGPVRRAYCMRVALCMCPLHASIPDLSHAFPNHSLPCFTWHI